MLGTNTEPKYMEHSSFPRKHWRTHSYASSPHYTLYMLLLPSSENYHIIYNSLASAVVVTRKTQLVVVSFNKSRTQQLY